MKKIFRGLGILLMVCGLIFLMAYSSLVTGSPDESFSRDLFGFPIPHPPVWTSFIPYLGSFLGLIFALFSIHGLIGVAISGVLLSIGYLFMTLGNEKSKEDSNQNAQNHS